MLWLRPENDEKLSIWDSDGDYYKQAVFDVPPTRGDRFSACVCVKIMCLCVCAGGAESPPLSKQQRSHLLPQRLACALEILSNPGPDSKRGTMLLSLLFLSLSKTCSVLRPTQEGSAQLQSWQLPCKNWIGRRRRELKIEELCLG